MIRPISSATIPVWHRGWSAALQESLTTRLRCLDSGSRGADRDIWRLSVASQALELSIEALRARRGTKWHRYGDDVLGAWVADMDFTVPAPVEAAIRRVVDEGDYGYGARVGDQG